MTSTSVLFISFFGLLITTVICNTIKSIKKQKRSTKDDLNKKIMETIKVLDNRPLNQKGVIISHFIGVAGMSPQQAEKYIESIKNDFSDSKKEIDHKVAFYKEYWFSDGDSGNNRIQIDII